MMEMKLNENRKTEASIDSPAAPRKDTTVDKSV